MGIMNDDRNLQPAGRRWPRARHTGGQKMKLYSVALCVVVATVALSSGCQSDADRALTLVRDACDMTGPLDKSDDLGDRGKQLDGNLPMAFANDWHGELSKRANLATDAAQLDPTWNHLARALSNMANEIPTIQPVFEAATPKWTSDRKESVGRYLGAVQVVQTECRKATP